MDGWWCVIICVVYIVYVRIGHMGRFVNGVCVLYMGGCLVGGSTLVLLGVVLLGIAGLKLLGGSGSGIKSVGKTVR